MGVSVLDMGWVVALCKEWVWPYDPMEVRHLTSYKLSQILHLLYPWLGSLHDT
jgi:hypothetical protein